MTTDRKSLRVRRRWFRFSLRTFFVFVTVVCIALGLYVKRVRDRHHAIETIVRSGGVVAFSQRPISTLAQEDERSMLITRALREGKPRPAFPENVPQGKSWLRGMFGKYGKYHGGDVYSVWLAENAFTPADATFEIGVISAIPEVKRLALGNVSPSALSKLSKMPRLESLTIESGPINDDDLECLAGSPHLQRLDLPSAELTSRGMATIGSRTRLTSLDLNRSSLDDAGFAHFVHLPLQDLSLKQSNTSDAAIPYLAQLKGLKELNIEYTNITEDGVQRLLRELPQCKIEHDYPWLD